MQPVVIQQQPYIVNAQPRSVSVTHTRGLGITQIVIGALSVLFGILSVAILRYWAGYVGFGIWGGIWILIGGIIGVCSASNPTNTCLNGANMAFAIVSSCITFIQFIVYCVAVTYYREYKICSYSGYYYRSYNCTTSGHSTGVAIYVVLLLLVIAEFAISLCVAIYCCKYGCQGCCDNSTTGVIVQQQQAHIVPSSVMVQSSGVVTTSYPAGYPAGYPMSTGMTVPYNVPLSYAPQGYSQAYTTGPPGGNPQMAYTTSAGQMQPANPTAMTYSQPGGAVGAVGAVGAEKQADAPPPYQ